MSRLINGIHHVSLDATSNEELEKTINFYQNILELEIRCQWDGGIMFDTGSGIIEVFLKEEEQLPKGVIRHFALATDDVAECAKTVKQAGYEVFIEPQDVEIPANPPFPLTCAFCYGPLGEEIEFFKER